MAPEECREGIYVLTYGPGLSLQVSTACCESDCSLSTLQGL